LVICINCNIDYECKDLCPDDVCKNCHSTEESFIKCIIRHELLAGTQCGYLTIKQDKPYMLSLNRDYSEWIEKCSAALTGIVLRYNYDRKN
jgi:hypothetical protein